MRAKSSCGENVEGSCGGAGADSEGHGKGCCIGAGADVEGHGGGLVGAAATPGQMQKALGVLQQRRSVFKSCICAGMGYTSSHLELCQLVLIEL